MDINTVFTFGVPTLVIGSIVWQFIKKKQEAEEGIDQEDTEVTEGPQSTTDLQPVKGSNTLQPASPQVVAKAESTPPKVMTLEQVVGYINDKIDDVPHWFCKGGTGSGKSTFIRLALAYRVARGENFVIMTGKRTSVFEDVPCIGRDELVEGEWLVTYSQVQQQCRELLRELVRRDHIPYNQRSFNVLNIVLDDASLLISEIEEAFMLVRQVGLLGRELKMRLIIATGSLLVKELGMEGRSDLRDHFAVITYNKRVDGSRETLLRPRYDDTQNIPFDAARVPNLSTRSSIDPSRSWKPVRSQQDELEDLNESWDYDPDQQKAKYKMNSKGFYMPVDHASDRSSDLGSNESILIQSPRLDRRDSAWQSNNNKNNKNNNTVTANKYNEALRLIIAGEMTQSQIAQQVGINQNQVSAMSKIVNSGE